MTRREVERAGVLRRVQAGELTLEEATPLLGVGYRQAKRLWRRYQARGAKGLVHGHTQRPSNRATPASERDAVLDLVRAHYSGPAARGPGQRFGPTLVAEHLAADHEWEISVTTLTRWMRGTGLWSRVRKTPRHHTRRPRRPHFGELVQLDGSFHDWFEGRGPRACVMTMIDDATGTTLVRFGAEETTWAAAELLQAWIARYGVPRALYTDGKTVYVRPPTSQERATGTAPLTQFGRMCAKLEIEIIEAGSPQAKGRVERGHGTHQDRLIKKLRLAGVGDVAGANAFVEAGYLAAHNARYAVAATSAVDYHRARRLFPADADVFCLETERQVGNDFVVQYGNQGFQLDRRARGRVPVKSRVLVREDQAGTVRLVHVGPDGRERVLGWTPAPPRAPRRAPATPTPVETPPAAGKSIPAPDHPWRQQHRQWRAEANARRTRRAAVSSC